MAVMKHVDVLIVGGGPAASAMAMHTDERLRVLVVDKRQLLSEDHLYDNEKCCGGMLDDTAQKVLKRMHLELPEEVIAEPQVFAVHAVDFMTKLDRSYSRNYMNMHRVLFDRFLLEKAAQKPNVELMEGTTCYDFMESKEGVAVCLRHLDGTTEVVMTRYLVGADGAKSSVKSSLMKQTGHGPWIKPRVYVAIQEWFEQDYFLPHYMAMFDKRVTDFYTWAIPKEAPKGILLESPKESPEEAQAADKSVETSKQLMIGAAIPQEWLDKMSAQERFDILKKDMEDFGLDLSRSVKKLGSVIIRPRAFGSTWSGESRVFLIGEACGLISPSSAEGISFALRSGKYLADSMKPAVPRHMPPRNKKQASADNRKHILGKVAKRINSFKEKHFRYGNQNPVSHKELIRTSYLVRLIPMKISMALKTVKAPLMYNKLIRTVIFLSRLTSIKTKESPVSGGQK